MKNDPLSVEDLKEQRTGNAGSQRGSGLVAEQPINDFPEYAEVKRGYAKWTDNNGEFHKIPLEGRTAIRGPAHEQHDLEVEDRDALDQASAAKTPRRNNSLAGELLDFTPEIERETPYALPSFEGTPKEPEEPKDDFLGSDEVEEDKA